jgi:hypothetical protein
MFMKRYDTLTIGETMEEPLLRNECPVGKVQVAFVGCPPTARRSAYGWKPVDAARIEVYVDGRRFHITIGDFHDGVAARRGVHISTEHDLHGQQTSINAWSLWHPTDEKEMVKMQSEGGSYHG